MLVGDKVGERRLHLVVLVVCFLALGAVATGCEETGRNLISEDQAVAIAEDFFTAHPSVIPSTTTPPGEPTISTACPGIVVTSAELEKTDAEGITGGRTRLVWIVRLGGSTAEGVISTTVFIDAETGEVLTGWMGP